ncbi:PASTA domain-containing protein [Micromonospora thermarum]|uniref:PASTA domain-containing protein n=1 Tax=Micromonospora thermarum TaxID=2720024 RepID=A0ABX0YYS6_9ACTN|nr:PASTA domain-containing protein [Micromonospora thermarum]NJP30642.1 PASTA domain-containing protein [Micromonospora thermarum]
MTDGNATPGARHDRVTLVLGGGLATVLLAAIGATTGWILAGEDDRRATSTAGASATPTAAPVTATSSRPIPSRSTPSRPAVTGPTVPDVVGRDFDDARDELEERGLRWRLVFEGGSGRAVERTYPKAGTAVTPGRTVTLYVSGPPPVVRVPDVVDEDCAEAAEELAGEGFRVVYTLRRSGTVLKHDPAGDSQAPWGDPVALWCGEPADGTPSPNP